MLLLAGSARRRYSAPPSEPPPYVIPATRPYNAPQHLSTPTYDGSGNTVHPDVVDFATMHGIPAWNGYRFWMAHTPYPNSNDQFENPSVLASHNGWEWETPVGLTNPLYPTPAGSFNFDTDWAYDPAADQLVLIFGNGNAGWKVARSSDGITWPANPPSMMLDAPPEGPLSKSLVQMADGSWRMFAIGVENRTLLRWSAATPEGPWTLLANGTGLGATTWHLDVCRRGGRLLAFIDCAAENDTRSFEAMRVASSADEGLTWAENPDPVIIVNSGGWDTNRLYRGSIQPHENGTHMRAWYCGLSVWGSSGTPSTSWHVGMTAIPLTEWPSPPTP